MSVSPKLRRRWWRAVLQVLLVLIVSLALLEVVARISGEPPDELSPADDPVAHRRQLIVNGWLLRPAKAVEDCEQYVNDVLGGVPCPAAAGEVPNSSQGFRDTELADPKPAGQIRILFLGDSSVYGAWICRLETLAELLEAGLNEQSDGPLPDGHRRIEVINAGVPGYSTWQSLEVLRRALPYGIDGVIVYNMISDVSGPEGAGDDPWFRWWAPPLRVLGHSATVRWAHYFVGSVLGVSKGGNSGGVRAPEPRNRVHVRRYMDNLRRIAAIASEEGAWTAYVIPPLLTDVESADEPRGNQWGPLSEGRTAEFYRGTLGARMDLLDRGNRPGFTFVNEDYRMAMALVAWEGGHAILDGGGLIRAAAAGGAERSADKPDSLMIDAVHPGPAGNRVMAQELIPMIADLL